MMDDRQKLNQQLVTLMTTHQRSIYGYIVSLLGSPADADDVLQNTYLAIWRKAEDFHGQGHFMTWACRIAYYEVLAHLKRRRRDATRVGFDAEMLDRIAAMAGEIMRDTDSRITTLRECVKQLDDRSRRLLQMRYGQELSPQQIAEQTGGSKPGAIRVALYRIRKTLLQCIHGKLTRESAG